MILLPLLADISIISVPEHYTTARECMVALTIADRKTKEGDPRKEALKYFSNLYLGAVMFEAAGLGKTREMVMNELTQETERQLDKFGNEAIRDKVQACYRVMTRDGDKK